MIKYPHFQEIEFTRANPSCSLNDMDPGFMARLEEARASAGVPFVINSAYRTKEHDLAKGRSGSGMHTKGRAVDIRCTDSRKRYLIVAALLSAGFGGIGIADNFIHVDDRIGDSVIFTY